MTNLMVGTVGRFEVVAMAASAGGLSALSEVLAPLPADFGAAIVLVQHLDPKHRSMMAEILGRRTSLAVHQAAEGDRIGPGGVWVAPSGSSHAGQWRRHDLAHQDRVGPLRPTLRPT